MINYLRRLIPRRFQSATAKCPTPRDVFSTLVNYLTDLDDWDRAYFKAKSCKWWIEVQPKRKGDNFLVTIKFPYDDTPADVLREKGVELPKCFMLRKFKRRNKVQFEVFRSDISTIAPFLDSVFKQLYGCSNDYIVSGKLILGFWQY